MTDDQRAIVAEAVRGAGGSPTAVCLLVEQMEAAEAAGLMSVEAEYAIRCDGGQPERVPLRLAALSMYAKTVEQLERHPRDEVS